jgi:hypothetical protein
MGGMKKIGNWDGTRSLIGHLASDLDNACSLSARRFGLIAEGTAKGHISKQDLGWDPLNEDYAEQKVNEGLSENILVATSSYFQSITSWADKYTGYAGVKKKVYNEDGQEIADIAKTHEYGTSIAGKNNNITIPSRPLWQPTITEAFQKWKETSTPLHFYKKKYNL